MKNSSRILAGLTLIGFASSARGATGVHIPVREHASGGHISLAGAQAKTLTTAQVSSAGKTTTHGIISHDRKRLTFSDKSISLMIQTGPANDMLSYRVAGLRNPTLVVPKGATLKVLFLNVDDDMYHNIRFGAWNKTYPNDTVGLVKSSVGTPQLAHKTEIAVHAEDLTLNMPKTPGKYAYFCTVRGHAQGGMWGILLVR